MRAFNKKIVFIYLFLFAYIAIKVLTIYGNMPAIGNTTNVVIWFIACMFCVILTRRDYNRYLESSDKTQVTFIIVLIYLMVYFLAGLITGYQHNAYSLTLKGIAFNTFVFIPVIIFQEYIRQVLINYSNSKTGTLILITTLFIALSLNFASFQVEMSNPEAGFKYLCSTLLPLVVSNMVFTYLTYVSSCKPTMVYRVLTTAFWLYLPILPVINWFYTGLCGILVPVVIYIIINYSHTKRVTKMSRKEEKAQKPASYIPSLLFTLLVMGFVLGFFKYQPVAVVSNSMYPFFARGDVVVVEKLKEEEMSRIKVNDIIKYEAEGFYIVHRVIEIGTDKNGNLVFTTKGDNNNTKDADKITTDKVKGVYLMHVKYLGFPSVWLSEALR